MVAEDFLQDPQVRKWLDGVEPAWTLLTFESLRALRQEPSAVQTAIRIANGLGADEVADSPRRHFGFCSIASRRRQCHLIKRLILRIPQWCLTSCQAKPGVFDYSNGSSRKRRHTTLGYRSPIEFKKSVSTESGPTSMCLGRK